MYVCIIYIYIYITIVWYLKGLSVSGWGSLAFLHDGYDDDDSKP